MRAAVALAIALAAAGPALAEAPRLAAYVTDQDEDVFVALYGTVAVELAGCPDAGAARGLLQLPADAPLVETTLGALTADNELGRHPRLPCGAGAAFDADLPATAPIWADLGGTEQYYVAASAAGTYYAVPLACDAIKAALAIRQRIQLPGVLRGQSAPPDLGAEVVLDCGDAAPDGGGPVEAGPVGATAWSLHRVDTFLSSGSVGDSIYVARYAGPEGAAPVFLPIWRVDGAPAGDAIWEGGTLTASVEAGLRRLFGLTPAAEIAPLGFEALAAIQPAVHVDLCLAACEGYGHRHAFFAAPGIDLDLTELPPAIGRDRVDLLGRPETVWSFAADRAVVLAGCDRLAAALGLAATAPPAWAEAVEDALAATEVSPRRVACGGAADQTCRRRIADGGTLGQADLGPSAACPDARRLVLELGAGVSAPAALVLRSGQFAEVEIGPAPGVGRATLRVVSSTPALPTSACLFAPAPALIAVGGGTRLTLSRVDLVRADQAEAGEVAAVQAEGSAVALDRTTIGAAGEGRRPVERAVRLCNADLYAVGGSVAAGALALQAAASRIVMAGDAAAPLVARGDRFGMLLLTGSTARLHQASIVSANPVVLRDAALTGSRLELAPGGGAAGDALRLERGAAARLTQSAAAGFRCLGVFFDAAARAEFVLPANDLARDNARLSCGTGNVTVVE